MKIFEVKTWIWDQEFTFKVGAETATEAIRVVNEKPASELLSQLKIGDFRASVSASPTESEDTYRGGVMLKNDGLDDMKYTHWTLLVPKEHCKPGLEVKVVAVAGGVMVGGELIKWADLEIAKLRAMGCEI